MKTFKQYINENEVPDILYHVTASDNVPKILKNGLIPNKSKLGFTYNSFGGKLSKKGYIYAFETFNDALKWLHHVTWQENNGKDYSAFRILKFNDNKNQYEQDTHWQSSGGKGKWLMKQGGISANAITLLPIVPELSGRFLTGDDEAKEEDVYNTKHPNYHWDDE